MEVRNENANELRVRVNFNLLTVLLEYALSTKLMISYIKEQRKNLRTKRNTNYKHYRYAVTVFNNDCTRCNHVTT